VNDDWLARKAPSQLGCYRMAAGIYSVQAYTASWGDPFPNRPESPYSGSVFKVRHHQRKRLNSKRINQFRADRGRKLLDDKAGAFILYRSPGATSLVPDYR